MSVEVIGLGELLIDFTPMKTHSKPAFEQNPGGAPVNVLAAIKKLGIDTGFIGCVGQDQFGVFLKSFIESVGVDSQYLKMTDQCPTTLAFVHLQEDGDRDFSFYRNPGADLMLSDSDIHEAMFNQVKGFHFGSLSLTAEPARSATIKALDLAKSNKCIVSYDPNLREPLWPSLQVAKETILSVMSYADVLKISEEELEFLIGDKDIEKGSKVIGENYNIPIVIVTMGADGCSIRQGDNFAYVPGEKVKAVDTTGAGDSHFGAMLYHIIKEAKAPEDIEFQHLIDFVKFANVMAAFVTTQFGSAAVMPSYDEVKAMMK